MTMTSASGAGNLQAQGFKRGTQYRGSFKGSTETITKIDSVARGWPPDALRRRILSMELAPGAVVDELEGLEAGRSARPAKPPGRDGQQVALREGEVVSGIRCRAETQHRSGGETEEGVFVQPTIVDNVGRDNKLFVEEIVGPVLRVTRFETLDEAIELANDTVCGLAASAYTGSLRNALRLSREIRAGVVTVNCFGEGDVTTPFGGYKESGFGGRDKSIWAHDQYTELKTIWINAS